MDILIISDFMGKMDGSGNGRFDYLAKMLIDKHDVEILTSDFNHNTKSYFSTVPSGLPYKVTMVHECAYDKNVCLKRNYAHIVWAKNVKKYLYARKKPDVIYCAIPPLTPAFEAAKYCEKNQVRFIIDIQDLWPEAFKMVFHMPVINKIFFAPLDWLADGIYKRADEIIAVSQTYVDRALKVNHKCNKGYSVFLGTDLATFDKNVQKNLVKRENSEEIWLGYCGSMGDSYDLNCVLEALSLIENPPKLIAMGDGQKKEQFERYAKEKKVDAVFTGMLPYDQMCGRLAACDIVVNPIACASSASIINKHADYAAVGLPILNTQENPEYRKLIDTYQMGFNCENSNASDLADKLQKLINNLQLRRKMGKNARKCAEEKFDRITIYRTLKSVIVGEEDRIQK